MSRRTSAARAKKTQTAPAPEETPELSVVPDLEEGAQVGPAEEDYSQEVPEGVNPETGELYGEPEVAAPDAAVEAPVEVPEGMTVAPGVEATQEVVDAVAADAAAEFARWEADGGRDEAPEGQDPPAEGEGEAAPVQAVEPEPAPAAATTAGVRKRQRAARAAAGKPVKLPSSSDAAPATPVEPEAEPVKKAAKKPVTKEVKAEPKKRVRREKVVLEGGWPVDTGQVVRAQQRPEGVAMPTGRANWFRAAETHYVWVLDAEVHGTAWLDISFDRKIRTAEIWWTTAEGGHAQRHFMQNVSSDEDALKALGFTCTFPATEDEVVFPEGITSFQGLWDHARAARVK